MGILASNKGVLLGLICLSQVSCDSSINYHKEFFGKWESGVCQEGDNSRSFIQSWKESEQFNERDIKVWNQPNCPVNITPALYEITSITLYPQYNATLKVSTTCNNGKAIKRDLTVVTLIKDGKRMVKLNEFSEIKDPELRTSKRSQKMNKLIRDNIGNVLPKYDLICLDDAGRLRIGNLSAKKDGLTEAKRPVEMNSQVFFIKERARNNFPKF